MPMKIAVGICIAAACVVGTTANAEPTEQTVSLGSLQEPVRIEFDPYAVPHIVAGPYTDAARALGYLHAQERYFQMDMIRRQAAGRLSEIVGPDTINMDRGMRIYGFESIAEEVVGRLPARHQSWLEAYRDGVNAALADLPSPPLEYGLLGVQPEPWEIKDSILVLLYMTYMLRSGDAEDLNLYAVREALPPELVEFLSPPMTRFDAPLDGTEEDPTGGYKPAPIPGPEVFSTEKRTSMLNREFRIDTGLAVLGSNSWAVAGTRTSHGGAIVANDMHLPLMLPNIWYRAALEWDPGDGSRKTAAGVSLPGIPGIVAGASDSLAWGFTNLTADLVDLVPIETMPDDENRCRCPDGFEAFQIRREVIEYKAPDAEPAELEVQVTRWGPITDVAPDGTRLAMQWGALNPENTNLRLLDLAWANSLEEGLEIARAWRGPAQNIVMADAHGDIAWTIAGFVPDRFGFDGRIDSRWADGTIGWKGNLEGPARPQIVRPESGILFTANNRVISADAGTAPHGNGFALGVRAQRIRERLVEAEKWEESDVFAVALDTRASLFEPYRDHLLAAMEDFDEEDPLVERAIEIVKSWDGTSNADQPGFRLLKRYRFRIHREALAPIIQAVSDHHRGGWTYSSYSADEPVLRLLEEKPPHFLAPNHETWEELQRWVFVLMVHEMGEGSGGGIETQWGVRNLSRIGHPFAALAPGAIRRAIEIPPTPQSGDTSSVRVATPTFGASERFAISPGRLEQGLIHMPGGQSGRPLNRHFRDQHAAWQAGEPLSLLPSEVISVLLLSPTGPPPDASPAD
ncbi:MAG: penicillin acylase family protein [Phycisphaerales bacterium JB050]